jgi:hypothetical protein
MPYQPSTWKPMSQNQGMGSMLSFSMPTLCTRLCQAGGDIQVLAPWSAQTILPSCKKFNPLLFAGMMFCDANNFASQCCLDVSPLGLPPFSNGLFD